MKNPELLHIASEQFLGKKEHEIKFTVLQTLEGHLIAILGTLTVEEVYKDRDQFAQTVTGVAQVGHDPHYYPQCHHPSQSILGEENEEP